MTREEYLQTWTECVGRFTRLEIGKSQVSVVLSCGTENLVLSFPKNSPESEVLHAKLSSIRPGARVGLLRTDKTFHVRSIDTAGDDLY